MISQLAFKTHRMIQRQKLVTPILESPRLPPMAVPQIQVRTPPLFSADIADIADVHDAFTAGVQEIQDDLSAEIDDSELRVTAANGTSQNTSPYNAHCCSCALLTMSPQLQSIQRPRMTLIYKSATLILESPTLRPRALPLVPFSSKLLDLFTLYSLRFDSWSQPGDPG